jgi:hypothetical protein
MGGAARAAELIPRVHMCTPILAARVHVRAGPGFRGMHVRAVRARVRACVCTPDGTGCISVCIVRYMCPVSGAA